MKKLALITGLLLLMCSFNGLQADPDHPSAMETHREALEKIYGKQYVSRLTYEQFMRLCDYHFYSQHGNQVPAAGGNEGPNEGISNITDEIPVINTQIQGFKKISDVAQYGKADWANVIGISHNVTLQEAVEIARNDPEIIYFFYIKSPNPLMLFNSEMNAQRVFKMNDAVFFSGEPWWGAAPGLSDGYIKE